LNTMGRAANRTKYEITQIKPSQWVGETTRIPINARKYQWGATP
jgi:hypothetical protein